MAEPFLSEIRIFSFNFAPRGWATCDGQLLPINQNQALFSLLGTTYGGNGQTNFGLPDLRGRVPFHFGSGGGGSYSLGQKAGEETHTLTLQETPTHNHTLAAGSNATTATAGQANPVGNYLANSGKTVYVTAQPNSVMSPATVSNVGGSQPHENRSPYLTLNLCIALQGIFPSPN
jgi:microcystin-dependent protein